MPFQEITTNVELEKILKKVHRTFDTRVMAVDQLKLVTPRMNQIVIVNFKKAGSVGTHWVLVVCFNKKYVLYFDSYGLPPSEPILTFLRRYKSKGLVKDILHTTNQIQGVNDKYCGWAVLTFLKYILIDKIEPWIALEKMKKKDILTYGKKLSLLYLK